jgi:hypothetical protein
MISNVLNLIHRYGPWIEVTSLLATLVLIGLLLAYEFSTARQRRRMRVWLIPGGMGLVLLMGCGAVLHA